MEFHFIHKNGDEDIYFDIPDGKPSMTGPFLGLYGFGSFVEFDNVEQQFLTHHLVVLKHERT